MPFRALRHLVLLSSLLGFATLARALEISVPVGGNIQAAVDQVAAAGGGTVNLAAGAYSLADTLLIKSNVRLSGRGRHATVITGGDFPVIKQAGEGLHDVVIEKLKVTGKLTEKCYGILIEAYQTWHENITLRDVEVTGTGMGVHIKRSRIVLIENSRIHANGAAGKEGYYHNLYLRSCDNARVLDCNLDRSTSGNGLNVSYCTDIVVERTTARDNHFRGMRAAETDGFAVVDCTITGNGGTGLIANQEKGNVTKRLDWRGNTASKNRDGGIRVHEGSTGKIRDNTATGNRKFDYQIPADVTQSGNR
jgi:parallel beta-helix repeat protein